jgi:hypothetical protein
VTRVSKRGTADVQVGPHIKKPYVAMGLTVFLVIDWMYLHIVHHLLGNDSGGIVTIIFLLLLVRLGFWVKKAWRSRTLERRRIRS